MGFCHTTPINRQRGSAIVFAMGLSLLVVALSVALLLWLTLDIRRVQQLQDATNRLAILQFAEAIAAEKIQALPEGWAEPWEIKTEQLTGNAQLTDLTGRLNINTLLTSEANEQDFFSPSNVIVRFLTSQSVQDPKTIVESIESQHHMMLGVRQIPGLFTLKDYFYGGASDSQQVNINTVSPEVLSAILDVSPVAAAAILAKRPFESMEDLHEVLKPHELKYDPPDLVEKWVGIEGYYYVLEISLQHKREVRVYSVFHKNDDKVTLKWRSWGTLP